MDDPAAAFALYWAYAEGKGVPRDTERAMQLLRSSAEAGHAPAQTALAAEVYGASKDEALRWFLAAAAQGDAEGALGAGRMLYHARFVVRDEARGLELLARAAAAGNEDAVREHAEATRQVAAQSRSDEENLAHAIAEHGLDAHAAAIRAMARPSVRLVTVAAEDAQIAIGARKLGGAPDLPADHVWPMRDGRPLAFIAQVPLADVGGDGAGLLSFFYDADQQPWGSREEQDGWRVEHHADVAALARHPGRPAFRACAVETFSELTLPPGRSALARGLGDDVMAHYHKLHGAFCSAYRRAPRGDGDVHRVGGHPDAIQGDMTRRIEYGWRDADLDAPTPELEDAARTWRLLLQIDSDDRCQMMWGDLGRLYFWIREDDLRAGRWETVRLQLQCS